MDATTFAAISYGLAMVVGVIALLFTTRKAVPSTSVPISAAATIASVASGAQTYGKIIGAIIPYIMFGIGPLIDLYNRKLKYSIISIIGGVSMVFAYGIQAAVGGSNGYLSGLTIATSAMFGFLLQDLWTESGPASYQTISTVLAVLLLGLQVLNSASGTAFANPLLNDVSAVLLGGGLGVLSWIVMWSFYKTYLPYFVLTESPKK